jgi:hypothetical protein
VSRFRYSQFCPVARAVELLGERWTLLIGRELLIGPQRFSDLLRRLPGLSSSVLPTGSRASRAGPWRAAGRRGARQRLVTESAAARLFVRVGAPGLRFMDGRGPWAGPTGCASAKVFRRAPTPPRLLALRGRGAEVRIVAGGRREPYSSPDAPADTIVRASLVVLGLVSDYPEAAPQTRSVRRPPLRDLRAFDFSFNAPDRAPAADSPPQ